MKTKIAIYALLWLTYLGVRTIFNGPTDYETDLAMHQMNGNVSEYSVAVEFKNYLNVFVPVGLIVVGFVMFTGDLNKMVRKLLKLSVCLLPLFFSGCFWRGYEPQKLVVIDTYEEGFLLPFTENNDRQTSSNNEEYLQKNLVFTQQIRIPQRWLQTGYLPGSGKWVDAALLIKVDKSPVTREWTADENSGTSSKNEAVWVMTSDQVEFSTGWTCTARILTKEDAVKFLHNYKNETLSEVLDKEVRAKIQTEFGMEVTDLPMDELRKNATPHLLKVIRETEEFFLNRGITITNLGITGGFVYKDKSISATLVRVFNAEQEKHVAIAEASAQAERNKKIQLEAEAKAKAVVTERDAEATGIRSVADAKLYEIENAKQNLEFYVQLKQLELSKIKLEKWDGKFPTYFMGNAGTSPELLLQMPGVK